MKRVKLSAVDYAASLLKQFASDDRFSAIFAEYLGNLTKNYDVVDAMLMAIHFVCTKPTKHFRKRSAWHGKTVLGEDGLYHTQLGYSKIEHRYVGNHRTFIERSPNDRFAIVHVPTNCCVYKH